MPTSEDRPEGRPETHPPLDDAASKTAAAARMQDQAKWVDLQVQQSIQRGEFDDLPGAGKPIKNLDRDHDPDWWVKQLIERERIVVLPRSVQLRKDDAELDDLIDRETTEDGARRIVEEFNERVIAARYGAPEGPPLITMPRDVEATLDEWRERRAARVEAAKNVRRQEDARKRRWWQRRQ
ncbi:DUF1992 domain-containing protein [Nocardioides albus]|uniref:DnaJ homologue subfamily C member 28 conserved domain-containing protein n=1 Tax=Nocardioides albus TaxID=1841 RepID=A0A7W5A741_9ACTN|nr:DUF1992 domain-containing protein [Nocardioides albus]MBB3090650.1 hypothetical protein [Nocardioides albus]GGU25463.1 hypothetical protein GCM10007979_25340 [Nocardioides albus]